MADHSDIHTDRYSFSEILYVYLIILAKYQHTLFAAVHLERMEQIMRDVCADFGCELAEFNGGAGSSAC